MKDKQNWLDAKMSAERQLKQMLETFAIIPTIGDSQYMRISNGIEQVLRALNERKN